MGCREYANAAVGRGIDEERNMFVERIRPIDIVAKQSVAEMMKFLFDKFIGAAFSPSPTCNVSRLYLV